MKNLMNKEMQENFIAASIIAVFAIVFYCVIDSLPFIADGFIFIVKAIWPFILGAIFAFFVNPIILILENTIFSNFKSKHKRLITTLITFLLILLFISFLIYILLPSAIESISDLLYKAPSYIVKFSSMLYKHANKLNINSSTLDSFIGNGSQLLSSLTKYLSGIFGNLLDYGFKLTIYIVHFIIGLITMFYLLIKKEKFTKGFYKIIVALFPKDFVSYLYTVYRVSVNIFYDYIVGKAIDSILVGIITFITLMIFNIVYADIFSIIIGISNMIPVFGPLIGSIFIILILLVIHPIQAIKFMIIIFIILQLNEKILDPRIFGERLHIGNFWILFSVMIGGSLFGIVGMFIGIPLFTVLFLIIKEYMNYLLTKKNNKII